MSAGGDDGLVAEVVVSAPPGDQPERQGGGSWVALRRFLRHRPALAGATGLVAVTLFAFLGAPLWRYRYDVSTADVSQPPSREHPFGTNSLGYDLLAQVMQGTQRSLLIAVSVGVVATAIGAIVGAVAGYSGGKLDAILMRTVDVFLMFPIIVVAAFLGNQVGSSANGWFFISLVLASLSWPAVARIVRGVTLSIKEEEFVYAARAAGANSRWIISRHVLPNAVGPISVVASILTASAILAETTLSYLGFGVQAPDTSLGLLINQAQGAIQTRPWLFYIPGVFVILIGICASFVGDGLRDAFSPSGGTR